MTARIHLWTDVVGGKKRFEGAKSEGSLSLMLSCV